MRSPPLGGGHLFRDAKPLIRVVLLFVVKFQIFPDSQGLFSNLIAV